MIKNKKLLLTLGSVSLLTVASMTAISCGNKTLQTAPDKLETKIGDVKLEGGEKLEAVDKKSVIMITDAGRINDKSFNQSTYEGGWLAANQYGMLKNFMHLIPGDDSKIEAQYIDALSNKMNVWLLSGFKHADPISNFYKKYNADMIKNKSIIVGTDYIPAVPEGYGIGLTFKVEQSAYIVGYAAADFLAKKYPDAKDAEKRSVYAFGGGLFDGVTGFIRGFYEGIRAYNKAHTDKKTKIILTQDKVDLASGFVPGDAMTASVTAAITSKASIILPVAGPATGELLEKMKGAEFNDKLVIGVDVDQSLSYESHKTKFFSSITKRIAQGNYDIASELYAGKDKYKIIKGFEVGVKSVVVNGDYANNLVGFAPTQVAGEDKVKAEAALKEAETNFKAIKDIPTTLDDKRYLEAVNAKDKGVSLLNYLKTLAQNANEGK
ncbi:BMP family ABC transporter substrate-binding protein [Mycoplasma crocodyli]|uniref:Putative sugar ABC transporter substrate-binding lipoprotein p48 n=1 Tax=Mycoplasma crocodyli (strain ATCC 51981 / MP145) TaxID=512564 RepID=D5E5K6_MYCCM|nr:BMP family ABC transporter substrate-binding protein [Mycoplasma crocodyli]ADE19917.1 putative sugar ABC transporter substrate-binding lipoprotein p48 [Mycoplasma crocodyli MP145]